VKREYYLLWSNRHGQRHWDGPFTSMRKATSVLSLKIDVSNPLIITPETKIWWPSGYRSKVRARDEVPATAPPPE
jgi:hypothetical protein